ncbi:inositol oxygenase [Delitschia confertaspora ATCC 74209]|uniref:Inositol oxygenase n=1 Tax=Delitschia confertaspora ATCC 74209 TaxID=1513339 RepID=A0A9P4JMC3_9PLEO|nr:inositol oxygenase [Delitschia confertaspora ATCC 74209]
MAPSAVYEHSISPSSPHRIGQLLEETSGHIDTINVFKGILQSKTNTAPSDGPSISTTTQPSSPKNKTQFRQYTAACSGVHSFYTEQHTKQTVAYNLYARHQFHHGPPRATMTVWEAIEKLNTLIDESDPDTELSQIQHLLQTAEAIRRDGKPRWMQLVGLIHDLGKLLYFFNSCGQWDVVGDTFPVGCAFSDKIIYHESFALNPDSKDPIYSTEHGIYSSGCGIRNVMLSWGHDEYLYEVLKRAGSAIPEEGLAMVRFHSFYAWHREGAYAWVMDGEGDRKMLEAITSFNPYDLYSKSDNPPWVEKLKPYYMELIDEFFGAGRKIEW